MDLTRRILLSVLVLIIAGVGGVLAEQAGLPMPYMIGALGLTAGLSIWRGGVFPAGFNLPEWMRRGFIALIGVLIGAAFSPDIAAVLPSLWLTVSGLVVFVALAHGLGYLIARRIGGYDRATAFYAATPGGLVESIELAAAYGADDRRVALQHFVRIVLVIVTVPAIVTPW